MNNQADGGGWFWLAALVLPFLTLPIVLIGSAVMLGGGEFSGLGRVAAAFIAFLSAVLLWQILSAISFIRFERYRYWSLLNIVPVVLSAWQFNHQIRPKDYQKEHETQFAHLLAKLRADPMLGIKEKWDTRGPGVHWEAVYDSFLGEHKIPYDAEMLEQAYAASPKLRSAIFNHPHCTQQFIEAHFEEAWETCNDKTDTLNAYGKHLMLAAMVSHPNCPLPLIKRVAEAKDIPLEAVQPARQALIKGRGGRAKKEG